MTTHPLAGCGTALVTPFTPAGEVDEPALRALVEWQLARGVHFLVPCGSTGEAATLTAEEHLRTVRIVAEQVGGRVPVVAGAGGNDTARAVRWSREVARAGATHLLHVSPMYNKPQPRGIVAHFRAIAEAGAAPVVVYNVPGRTGSNIDATTALALAAIPGIVGLKEASGQVVQVGEILAARPGGFAVLSGDDVLTLPLMALGADGVISVVSNATPAAMVALVEACARGDLPQARAWQRALGPWMATAFVESNPAPVKAALAMLGRCADVLRLPLVSLDAARHPMLRAALDAAGAFT